MPRALPRQITGPVVSVLASLGVTPNMLTVAQLIGGIIAGVIIANGELLIGGIVLIASAALDAFDGTLARTTGKVTKFGGVFDSTIDRMFEGAILGGILYYYLDLGAKEEAMLIFVAMVGSLCVSYVRARAEVEGVAALRRHLHPRRTPALPHRGPHARHPPPDPLDPRRRDGPDGVPPTIRDLAEAGQRRPGAEAVIPLKEQELLKQRFARELQSRVRVDFFGQKAANVYVPGRIDRSAVCADVAKLLHELAALNLRIGLTVHDIDDDAAGAEALGVERVPAIVLRGQTNRAVRYFGNPRMKQFLAFVEALLMVAHGKPNLQPETAKTLRKVRSDVTLKVFVTPACAHSPLAVLNAVRLALESTHVKVDVVRRLNLPRDDRAVLRTGDADDGVQRPVRHPRRDRRGQPGRGRAHDSAGRRAVARRRREAHDAPAEATAKSTATAAERPPHQSRRPHHPALSMRERLSRSYDTLAATDFTRTLPFVLLALVFFALRLPWVGYGHGTDPDAWRVAMTARYLLEHGDYFPSRLPGNPLHELTMTLFIPGGWIATNLATAAASLVGVWLFARIVNALDAPNRGLLVIAFAFTPLLVINSIATMDYMWTLTLLLGAYYSAITRRPLLAGILLGLAVGFRLQSVMLVLPLTYLLWRQGRRDEVLPFWFAAGGAAAPRRTRLCSSSTARPSSTTTTRRWATRTSFACWARKRWASSARSACSPGWCSRSGASAASPATSSRTCTSASGC